MQKIIESPLGEYVLDLVLENEAYYINEDECDENASVMLISKKTGEIISDNYFAYGAYFDALEKVIRLGVIPEFIREETVEYATRYFEEYMD